MSAIDKDALLRQIVKTYDNLVRAELGDFGQPAGVRAQEMRSLLSATIDAAADALGIKERDRR